MIGELLIMNADQEKILPQNTGKGHEIINIGETKSV